MSFREVPTLVPSTYLVTGRDGRPRLYTFTPADARDAANTLNKQLKAGLRIPVCLAHDPDAEPAYLSHKDPHYVAQWRMFNGYMGDAKKAFVKNGRMHVVVHIPDDADAKLFDKIGTVSPSIVRDWTDERGVTWKGPSVLHIGVTPKPVQRDLPRARAYQSNSRPDAICFSFPIPTGSSAMADEMDDDTTPGDGMGADTFKRIVDVVKKLGIHIVGDPSNDAELLIALESAVETKNGGMDDTNNDDMPADLGDDMGMDDTEAVPPAFMSHWLPQMAEVADAKRRTRIDGQLKSGRVSGDTAKMLRQRLDAVQLSHNPAKHFDKKGNLKPLELDAILDAFDLLPAGRFKGERADLGQTVPVHPPVEVPANREEAAAKELRDYAAKR